MDVKILREIRRKEKNSAPMQNIGKNFYQDLEVYLKEIFNKIKKSEGSDTRHLASRLGEFENIRNIVNDIYEARERKIVFNALYYVKSGDEIDKKNYEKIEEETLENMVNILRSNRKVVIEKLFRGEALIQKEPSAVANKKKDKQKEEFTTIRILKDLPSIVGVDGRVYGSFKIEDLVTLPIANADTFINRGVAEKVNLDR
jgi:DNA replication initiation complex subunit (GINS family)|tara:strand:+ start:15478 stop:16080 length:603 start_codon:yes stop_codon:yes gene_type:complete